MAPGPSRLEQVRSKTRPVFLPPKPSGEDERHLADWERMMDRSHAAGQQPIIYIDTHTHTTSSHQLKKNAKLSANDVSSVSNTSRPLSSSGRTRLSQTGVSYTGIPRYAVSGGPAFPATCVPLSGKRLLAILLPSAKVRSYTLHSFSFISSADHLRSCLARARRALSANLFPQATLDLIEQDVVSTLPSLHLFHPHAGPLYNDLKDMLYAWVIARSDEGLGYTYGAAKIAAMMLITMPMQQAFNVMRNLLERHCLRSFYGGDRSKDDVRSFPSVLKDLNFHLEISS